MTISRIWRIDRASCIRRDSRSCRWACHITCSKGRFWCLIVLIPGSNSVLFSLVRSHYWLPCLIVPTGAFDRVVSRRVRRVYWAASCGLMVSHRRCLSDHRSRTAEHTQGINGRLPSRAGETSMLADVGPRHVLAQTKYRFPFLVFMVRTIIAVRLLLSPKKYATTSQILST